MLPGDEPEPKLLALLYGTCDAHELSWALAVPAEAVSETQARFAPVGLLAGQVAPASRGVVRR